MPSTFHWRGVVADIERALAPGGRAALRRFVIEGTRLHERALRAGARLEQVLIAEAFAEQGGERAQALLRDLTASGAAVSTVPDEVVGRLTGGRRTGAIVGLAPIPAEPSLADTLRARPGRGPVVLIAVDIAEPGNVGALVRTALASGATALAVAGSGDPYHPKAVRTSMGSLFRIPVLRFPNASGAHAAAVACGLRTVGAVSAGGIPPRRLGAEPAGTALFVGSEAFGLPDDLAAALDARVTIPMADRVDSFSVNAAAAILLYEIGRRSASDSARD